MTSTGSVPEAAATIERDGYYLQELVTGEQAGTHWAAPAHFHSGRAATDELDPADFFYPAAVLDVRAGGWIIVGGIRIRAGSGSPATVFGLIP